LFKQLNAKDLLQIMVPPFRDSQSILRLIQLHPEKIAII
jgi:hypothetical protein